jgi:hypothetical protein
MSDSDWAIEQFFRDMEFGNPELLQNDYYMALRSTMREKADPSEREPRVDLVSLLDNSGKPKLSDASSVQIKRQSYMEMIAKDPGSMYDLSIYEEMKAKEELEKKIEKMRKAEEERLLLEQEEQEPPQETPIEPINKDIEDNQSESVIKPPEPPFQFMGYLVPVDKWQSIANQSQAFETILKEAFRERDWHELIPTTIKNTNEFRMYDYLVSRERLTEEEIDWAATLYDSSLTRIVMFLEIHRSQLPSAKKIQKHIEQIIIKRRMQIVKKDLASIREQEKKKRSLIKQITWRIKNG